MKYVTSKQLHSDFSPFIKKRFRIPQWKLIEKQHKHQISDSKVKGNINPILQDVIM